MATNSGQPDQFTLTLSTTVPSTADDDMGRGAAPRTSRRPQRALRPLLSAVTHGRDPTQLSTLLVDGRPG